MTPEERETQARNRFFAIGFARLAGAALAIFGIVVISGAIADLPPIIGYFMLFAGLLEFAFVPLALARAWRTPPGS